MDLSLTSIQIVEKIIALINVVLYLSVIIVGLNCIWRVERRLNKFLKIVIIAILLVPLRIILGVAGLEHDPIWMLVVRCFGFAAGALLLYAFVDLLRMLKTISHEK